PDNLIGETDEANNTSSVSAVVDSSIDLVMGVKAADDTTPAAGQTVTFTIPVSATGPATNPVLAGIVVVDTLPTGMTFVSASGTGFNCNAVGQVVTCTGSLTANAAATNITVVATVNANVAPATVLSNQAEIDPANT